jgi:hypothetical protein
LETRALGLSLEEGTVWVWLHLSMLMSSKTWLLIEVDILLYNVLSTFCAWQVDGLAHRNEKDFLHQVVFICLKTITNL